MLYRPRLLQFMRFSLFNLSQRVSTTEDSLRARESKLSALTKTVTQLQAKVDDLENRGRRKNLQIVGLPEKSEGSNSWGKWYRNGSTSLLISDLRLRECTRAETIPRMTRVTRIQKIIGQIMCLEESFCPFTRDALNFWPPKIYAAPHRPAEFRFPLSLSRHHCATWRSVQYSAQSFC